MFKLWIRDELDPDGQLLASSVTLADVEVICRSMNTEGVTGYENVEASWWWLVEPGRAGIEIVLAEV